MDIQKYIILYRRRSFENIVKMGTDKFFRQDDPSTEIENEDGELATFRCYRTAQVFALSEHDHLYLPRTNFVLSVIRKNTITVHD